MCIRWDGSLVVGARCTADGCGWGPVETEDPDAWDVVERARLRHERETGHVTSVEAARWDGSAEADGDPTPMVGVTVVYVCPDCDRTTDELGADRRCPDCGVSLRRAFP
ncbi:hypothetical protein [Candidatus Halobonum tyrrellensis]|uniref:Uncharacterized protein n=1 Tax=Candidatus Halobonum tyrrellensis G22 TaxID=1324957 RepID=V4HB12_9EURY|nr:hypothetical protein [Candidatus Halobonum tyrrellensis]ESP87243.1 hypothetical protein K933_15299 [Candidatus Halobonum tyrrellensis G22]